MCFDLSHVLKCPLKAAWEAFESLFFPSLSFCFATVVAGAPAAGAGVSTSCAAPPLSFLFSYHCSTAALSGRQPFYCSRTRFTYRRSRREKPASLCPLHPVEGFWLQITVTLGAFGAPSLVSLCFFYFLFFFLPSPWTQRAMFSAADWRHLVAVCAARLPACATLQTKPSNNIFLLSLVFCVHTCPAFPPGLSQHFAALLRADTPERFQVCHRLNTADDIIKPLHKFVYFNRKVDSLRHIKFSCSRSGWTQNTFPQMSQLSH